MSPDKKSTIPTNKNISISGDVKDSIVSIGDNNIFQKIINYIFPSEKETLEQRNRRILLNHVENAWIKGVLDASLHGAALLDLGIKQDPEAVTKYPWAIKKESTDETLPAGTSMLEIFDTIGMGRSLLILGAPGSGKTTMLLELARQLIGRAREDVTQPIPMVFNLASWTEKLTLADWLAQELNNLYSVPRKTAPDWVQGNKLLLLLDGLDEVRQESRAKCVEAINEFRKQNGLTSLAVCSRSQDYADLKAKLSFEGAIEVQPLTQEQITDFFNRFGNEMAGIKQALEKDSGLHEMGETPLFLSIMLMAYRDMRDVEILISGDEKARRKHLFDTYVERMFERRTENTVFKKQDVIHWLSWLSTKMVKHNQIQFFIENIKIGWLDQKRLRARYKWNVPILGGLPFMLVGWLSSGWNNGIIYGLAFWLIFSLGGSLLLLASPNFNWRNDIRTVDTVTWNFKPAIVLLGISLLGGLIGGLLLKKLSFGLTFGLVSGLLLGIFLGMEPKQIDRTSYQGERLFLSARIFLTSFLIIGLVLGIGMEIIFGLELGRFFGLFFGLFLALFFGGFTIIHHYALRLAFIQNNLLPWRLIPFLDHCVDLIFLRRVGGGYIFIHRLLMEHFAEMYVETPTSRGN